MAVTLGLLILWLEQRRKWLTTVYNKGRPIVEASPLNIKKSRTSCKFEMGNILLFYSLMFHDPLEGTLYMNK